MTLRLLAAAIVAVLGSASAAHAEAEMLPVVAATVYPGDTISDAMLVERAFPAGTSATFPIVVSRAELVGKVARRTLLPGKPVALNAIAVRDLVQRGTIIPATYEEGNLVITASVLALEAGALNAAIQVRNIDSGKVIVASVQADGSVRITGP